ncbi:MAG: COP23 domain-containing protein [Cyanobacteria bacterium P01_C01_bin.120]
MSQSSQAVNYPGLFFACDSGLVDESTERNVLYGMYRNGASIDLAQFSAAGGFDGTERCDIISQEFNQANLNNQLKFITSGKEYDQNIVCAVDMFGTKCNLSWPASVTDRQYTYLFTIANNENPDIALNRFLTRLVSSRNVGQILQDSESQQTYIDFEAYLQHAFGNVVDVSTGQFTETPSENHHFE